MTQYAFRSPGRYLQGVGLLNKLGEEASTLGLKALILSDDVVWNLLKEQVSDSFKNSDAEFIFELFEGEASVNEINRLTNIATENEADVIIALGGGKAIDTAKALAENIKRPVIIAPTAVSTDAPSSALSVIYSDEGAFESYRFYDKNPELVLVDTEVVVNYLQVGSQMRWQLVLRHQQHTLQTQIQWQGVNQRLQH